MLTRLKKPFLPLIVSLGKRKERRSFSKVPILIGGCARSGTTLLISILSAHKEIFACPKELGLFSNLAPTKGGPPVPTRMDRLYTCLLTHSIPTSSSRWLEKSPNNVRRIAEIDRYFEGKFKFVHIVRDGRDVVLSVHPTAKDRYWVSPDRWVNDVKMGLAFEDHPHVFLLKYEDLVADTEKSIAKLCEFLDLPLTDDILNWEQNATVRKHNAYRNGLQKIQTGSVQKWKQETYKDRVAQLMNHPGAKDLLQTLGYI